jgi:hypothetical protein
LRTRAVIVKPMTMLNVMLSIDITGMGAYLPEIYNASMSQISEHKTKLKRTHHVPITRISPEYAMVLRLAKFV